MNVFGAAKVILFSISSLVAQMSRLRLFVLVVLLVGAAATAGVVSNCSNPVLQCAGRGQCTNPYGNATDSQCLCNDNYITFPPDHYPECNYKQDVRIGPFLLQFFFGAFTGCGAFMEGENGWGIAQVVLFWGGTIVGCILKAILKQNDNNVVAGLIVIYIVALPLAIIAIDIVVLVFIGSGKFTDSNGAPMGGWT